MSNVDPNQGLYDQLNQQVGAWSAATGVPNPSPAQIASWGPGGPSIAQQFPIQAANIGYYSQATGESGNTAQIYQQAMADPRWATADATGRNILIEMYNVAAMQQDPNLWGELTQAVGAWSAGLGVAQPSPDQVNQWYAGAGGPTIAGQFPVESANIGYYSAATGLSGNAAQIQQAASQDPRWATADPLGQNLLIQLYNLKSMGYSGSVGQTNIGAPAAGGMTSTQQDAWAQLQQTLQAYGFAGNDLTALTNWAQQQIINGNSSNQIALNLMQTPQFEARFPAIQTLAQEGVAITPAQYIALEQQYAQLEQAAGLPPNFASFDELIANQVSPSEYSDRLTKGYLAVATAPPEVLQEFEKYNNVSQGDLVAYFLDPTKGEPILQQKALAAQLGGAASVSGFGEISGDQAMRLAQMGVNYNQALQGFQQLSEQRQLEGTLPGQGQRTSFSTDQLLGAQFGSDGQTKLQLAIQGEQEKNYFNQGTGVAGTSTGLTGAGPVQR